MATALMVRNTTPSLRLNGSRSSVEFAVSAVCFSGTYHGIRVATPGRVGEKRSRGQALWLRGRFRFRPLIKPCRRFSRTRLSVIRVSPCIGAESSEASGVLADCSFVMDAGLSRHAHTSELPSPTVSLILHIYTV